jgi:glutaredoxin-related protein
MRGSIEFPRCIQSKTMIELITGKEYSKLYAKSDMNYFDMDSDTEISPALIQYAHFSTIPMLFEDGKLVGSLDLIQEMHARKTLINILKAPEKAVVENKRIGMKRAKYEGDLSSPDPHSPRTPTSPFKD